MVKASASSITLLCLLIFYVLLMAGCGIFTPMKDEEPTFRKTEYLGNDIRMGGYFHSTFASTIANGDSVDRIGILFFNRNGVYMFGGLPTTSELPSREESFRNGNFVKDVIRDRFFWGVFKVADGELIKEGWSNPNGTFLISRSRFDIVNDTTLVRTISELRDSSGVRMVNEVYRFKAFSRKPDSVVDFLP